MKIITISNLTVVNSNAVVEILRSYGFEYNEPDNYSITLEVDTARWPCYRSFVADIVMNTSATIKSEQKQQSEVVAAVETWHVTVAGYDTPTVYTRKPNSVGYLADWAGNEEGPQESLLNLADLQELAIRGSAKKIS